MGNMLLKGSFAIKGMWMVVISGILILSFVNVAALSAQEEVRYNSEIKSYVSFLRSQSRQPVDYIMDLFNKFDIVIICERVHPEATQYDLIYDIVSDKRFVDKVGNVFTELGTSSLNDFVHDFMFADGLSSAEVDKKVLYIYRNFYWSPLWGNYNFFDFLRKLYSLNKSLHPSKKVNIYFSDMPFLWEGMTEEKYRQFKKTLVRRDKIMANQIIERFNEILESPQKRKKALVIMNYRHAFNDCSFANGGDNVGRYLFEAFPGKVSNVMLNSFALLPGTTDKVPIITPIHNGKWDAAFKIVGNPNLGFDFPGSPFGVDYFDYFSFIKHNLKYQDVFTGFIFYKSLKEHKLVSGIPGFFRDGYDDIILKRMAIAGSPVKKDSIQEWIQSMEKLREISYYNLDDITEKINQWLSNSKDKK